MDGKPDPEVFLKAAEGIRFAPSCCVVFEDAFVGIEAAIRGGMKVVAVATTNPLESLGRADLAVHRLDLGIELSRIRDRLQHRAIDAFNGDDHALVAWPSEHVLGRGGRLHAQRPFHSIVVDPDTAGLSDVDRAVLTLADKVAAGAADMTEADLGELRALGLDDGEILDVVLAAAARCFFSTVLDAVGAAPDPAYQDLDRQLREALTVGRPIEEPVAGR